MEGAAGVGFGDAVGMGARLLPRAGDDLRLPEHGPEMVDDRGLVLAIGHAAE